MTVQHARQDAAWPAKRPSAPALDDMLHLAALNAEVEYRANRPFRRKALIAAILFSMTAWAVAIMVFALG